MNNLCGVDNNKSDGDIISWLRLASYRKYIPAIRKPLTTPIIRKFFHVVMLEENVYSTDTTIFLPWYALAAQSAFPPLF